MRVSKTDVIAGMPAGLARSIVRKFRGREMVAEAVADLLQDTGYEIDAAFAALEAAGYMERVRTDNDGDIWWITRFTDSFETIYTIDKDPTAVPTPADRTLIGR